MTGEQMKGGRLGSKLTQSQAAVRLAVSQPYLSLLETGKRRVPPKLARRAAAVYRLPPTVLPVADPPSSPGASDERLVRQMAALGYPGYGHLASTRRVNPAEVVLDAVSRQNVDARVTAALPWVLSRYPDMDWEWLVSRAKLRNVQNRLGFLVSLGREVAERQGVSPATAQGLVRVEQELERARLAAETTLSREAMPSAEREWLRSNRPRLAEHWGVLTTLTAEQLPYVPAQGA